MGKSSSEEMGEGGDGVMGVGGMTDDQFGAKPAVLRCARCGKFVDWEEAQVQVVCTCRPHLDLPPVPPTTTCRPFISTSDAGTD